MSEPESTSPVEAQRGTETADSELFFNRELSWLEFNRRVLAEAEDPANPLLERLKFVAIFGSNLDEFFMKRIGGLKQQLASNVRQLTPDGRSPRQQLDEINAAVRPMIAEQHRIFSEDLVPALRAEGVELLRWSELRDAERHWLHRFFERAVFPILTPLALDPAHPFPFISNLSLSLAVAVRHPDTGQERFARIKVPRSLPRFVQLPDSMRFIPLEEVIAHSLDSLFPGMEVAESHVFRVSRNADGERNEEPADDLLEAIQEELRERRFATVVRLQVVPEMPRWMRALLCEELEVDDGDIFEVPLAAGAVGHHADRRPAALRAARRSRGGRSSRSGCRPRPTAKARTSSRPSPAATSWCTIRTNPSRSACSASSRRRRATRRCWRSSRRSTAPPASRRSCAPWSRRPRAASRWR